MRILSLLFALVFALTTAQAQGIRFFEGKWKDILSEAKKENKLIFMDAYTTWCGPCKMMASKIFPKEEVGAFFNDKFVNVQIDMEKGEGIELARAFGVMAYPTLLFVDGNGQLVHRAVGYHSVPQFLELGMTAVDPTKQLITMEKRYQNGERDPAFLYQLAMAKFGAYDGSHTPIAEAYLETQKDWSTPENRKLIFMMVGDTDSKMFDYLIEHRSDFEAQFGTDQVTGRLQDLIYQKLYDAPGNSSLEQIDALFKKAYPERADQLSANFRISYYRMAGETDKFVKAAGDYFDQYPSKDPDELNNVAWSFYEMVDTKKDLKKAVKWGLQSVKLSDSYYNNDTVAALYYKLGKKSKAKQYAEKAIAMAKAAGEDYSSTQELLDLINGGK